MIEISVIIPCYKSASVIGRVISSVTSALQSVSSEIILVGDGNTADDNLIYQDQADKNPHIKFISLDINHGQSYATSIGATHACGNFIVSMDDDGQHDPADIFSLKNTLLEGDFDQVYARFTRMHEPRWRRFVRMIFEKSSLRDKDISSFRIWTKDFNLRLNSQIKTDLLFDIRCAALKPSVGYADCKHHPPLLPSRYGFDSYFQYLRRMISSAK